MDETECTESKLADRNRKMEGKTRGFRIPIAFAEDRRKRPENSSIPLASLFLRLSPFLLFSLSLISALCAEGGERMRTLASF